MHSIPLRNDPLQTVEVTLDGQPCTITLRWMQERLFLDLDVGDIAVSRGVICQNRGAIRRCLSPYFTGSLHFYDWEGESPPRWDDLHDGVSGRWMLLYRAEHEVIDPALQY